MKEQLLTEKHEHEFIETSSPDERMLCGYSSEGLCKCGVRQFHTRIQIKWLLNSLIGLEKWKRKRTPESLTITEIVYLVKKWEAVNDLDKFTEVEAKLFKDNLDKCL